RPRRRRPIAGPPRRALNPELEVGRPFLVGRLGRARPARRIGAAGHTLAVVQKHRRAVKIFQDNSEKLCLLSAVAARIANSLKEGGAAGGRSRRWGPWRGTQGSA